MLPSRVNIGPNILHFLLRTKGLKPDMWMIRNKQHIPAMSKTKAAVVWGLPDVRVKRHV